MAGRAADSAYQLAALHAQRREADVAFAWLDRGVAQRDAGISQAYAEPAFRFLHGDARWRAFVRKVGIEGCVALAPPPGTRLSLSRRSVESAGTQPLRPVAGL